MTKKSKIIIPISHEEIMNMHTMTVEEGHEHIETWYGIHANRIETVKTNLEDMKKPYLEITITLPD